MSVILGISGSLRGQSTNMIALRTVQAVAPQGVTVLIYGGMGLLPHFNPDDEHGELAPEVVTLRTAIHDADALLFATPEYAGALPGTFKNLLDWTIGDDDARSIYEKPVGWVNTSPRGAVEAHASLRKVLGFAHAQLVDAACVDIALVQPTLDADGAVIDPAIRAELRALIERLASSSLPARVDRADEHDAHGSS